MTIIALERSQAILGDGGVGSLRVMEFLEELTRQTNTNTVLTGSGSPEGVLEATPPKFYVDTDTDDYYRKTGTGDTGWVLV